MSWEVKTSFLNWFSCQKLTKADRRHGWCGAKLVDFFIWIITIGLWRFGSLLSSPMSMSLVSLVSLPLFVSASLVSGLVRQVLRLIRTITSIIRAIIKYVLVKRRVLTDCHRRVRSLETHSRQLHSCKYWIILIKKDYGIAKKSICLCILSWVFY